MDRAYVNASKKLSKLLKDMELLREQVAEKRLEVARIQRFLIDWKEFASMDDAGKPSRRLVLVFDAAESQGKKRSLNPPKEAVGAEVAAILRENGAPMSRTALFAALAEKDITIKGANPLMILSTMLWRLPGQFIRVPGQGYWFAGQPLPPSQGDASDKQQVG